MKKITLLLSLALIFLTGLSFAQGNVGIGTTTPQAKLDVNGTFKLQNGVIVNGISADSTFTPGSDSLLPTQLAVKRYIKSGTWAQSTGSVDSILYLMDYSTVDDKISGVDARDSLVYATSRGPTNYLNIFDVSDPTNIVLRSRTSLYMNSPVEVEVSGNFAYVLNNEIFYNSLSIFDISDPDTIIPVSQATNYLANPADLDIVGNYAYIATNGGWLTIYDISNPYAIVLTAYSSTNLHSPTAVEVSDGIAYVTSWYNDRLCLFDVSNPSNIVPIGFTSENIYKPTHLDIEGNYVYVTSSDGVTIFNKSDPNNLTVVGNIPPSYGQPAQIHVKGNVAYVATPSHGNMKAFNVSDPANPVHVGTINGFGDFYSGTLISKFDTEGAFIYAGSASQHMLGAIRWFHVPDSRVLVKEPGGGTSFEPNHWQKDSLSNLFVQGVNNVGIGTYFPSAKLHLNGNMKIENSNTIEFGAGAEGKQEDAGKIGYNTFSGNALDIVGAGAAGNRKIKLYAEGGTTLEGKMIISDSMFVGGHTKLDGNLLVNNGWVGIGNYAPTVPLHLTGNMKIDNTGTIEFGAGVPGKQQDAGKIGYQTFSTNALDIIGAGSPNNRKIQFYAEGGSNFSGKVDIVGKLSVNDSVKITAPTKINGNLLVNSGWVGIGNLAPQVPLHLSGLMKVDGINTIEFGAGVAGKNADAGKIGYQVFSPNSLDIVGAGATGQRRVKFFAEAGVNVAGKLTATDSIIGTNAKLTNLSITNTLSVSGTTSFQGNMSVQGNLGVGTSNPTAKLHVAGNQKIDGTNSLEFGAGVPGKQVDAGKIGYTMYSNALDIIGAGASNQRRIKLWAEAGTTVEGKLITTDSIRAAGSSLFQSNLIVNGNLGISTSNPNYKLDVNGRIRLRHNGESSGIFFNKSNNTEAGFVGMQSDNNIGFYGNGGGDWNFVMNTTNGNVGIGTTNPTATLHVGGNQKMNNANTIEFGSNVAGKNPDAGKIGYQTFTTGALDIVGAGSTPGNRKVKMWDILEVDSLNVQSIASGEWEPLILLNNWQDYGNGFATAATYLDPLGVMHFRGTISGGSTASGTILFNLLEEYAPQYGKVMFLVPCGGSTARIEVLPNGNFVFYGSSNAFVSLDQISYRIH